jgi:hypothetical protein
MDYEDYVEGKGPMEESDSSSAVAPRKCQYIPYW